MSKSGLTSFLPTLGKEIGSHCDCGANPPDLQCGGSLSSQKSDSWNSARFFRTGQGNGLSAAIPPSQQCEPLAIPPIVSKHPESEGIHAGLL
jgi:hypothetical protein